MEIFLREQSTYKTPLYTTNGSEWGLSVGFGGKGVGLGYYMNEINTIITGEKLNNPCKQISQWK